MMCAPFDWMKMTLETKNGFRPKKNFETKAVRLPRYHSNCAVLTARRPFGVQQPLCPDAAVLGEALPAARRPRTPGSGAIGPGDPCRRLPPPAGSLRAPVSVPLLKRPAEDAGEGGAPWPLRPSTSRPGSAGVSGGFPPDRHLSDGGGGYHTAVSARRPGAKSCIRP